MVASRSYFHVKSFGKWVEINTDINSVACWKSPISPFSVTLYAFVFNTVHP